MFDTLEDLQNAIESNNGITIIHGTYRPQRPQDLIPAFLNVIAWSDFAQDIINLYPNILNEDLTVKDENDEWWESDACEYLIDDLFAVLNEEVAPKGFYFGSTDDDASDFGFWPYDEDCDCDEDSECTC